MSTPDLRGAAWPALTAAVGLTLLVAQPLTETVSAQPEFARLPLEHPAIRYGRDGTDAMDRLDNPVTWLIDRLDRGETALDFRDDGFGYLPSLLDELDLRVDSQILVSSKTSFQTALISRANPRAIYFNDHTAVGFVRGGDIEVIALDPRRGAVFYTLPARPVPDPRPTRATSCLQCHYGPETRGVPGLSIGPVPIDDVRPVDSSLHLADTSDPVALRTLEHQTHITNVLTRLEWESRIARHGGLIGYGLAEHMRERVDDVLGQMLFVDEVSPTEPIRSVSSFSETFPQRGPHDRHGRSLRDFDLETRLFRYPLSYMIYSRAFVAVEPVVREYLLRRLYDVLIGDDTREPFSAIAASDRRAILTILRDTKPDLPAYWRARQGEAALR